MLCELLLSSDKQLLLTIFNSLWMFLLTSISVIRCEKTSSKKLVRKDNIEFSEMMEVFYNRLGWFD